MQGQDTDDAGEVQTTVAIGALIRGVIVLVLLGLGFQLQSTLRHRWGPHYRPSRAHRIYDFAAPVGFAVRQAAENPRVLSLLAPDLYHPHASIAVGDRLYRYPWRRPDLDEVDECARDAAAYASRVGAVVQRAEVIALPAGESCQYELSAATEGRIVTSLQSDAGDRIVLCRWRPTHEREARAGCAAFLNSWRWRD